MDALGLPCPETLFGSIQAATGTATTILAYIKQFGTKVTVRELVIAGTGLEALMTVGAGTAAYYYGAVVGSIAIASFKHMTGGLSIADVIYIRMGRTVFAKIPRNI